MRKQPVDEPFFGYYIVGPTFEALKKKVHKNHLKSGALIKYKGNTYLYTFVLEWGIYMRQAFRKLKDKSA